MKLAPFVLASLLSAAPLSAGDSKQNWQFAKQFWTLDQGSKIMPWNWFMHLEKADGTGLLKDDLTRFGFIPGTVAETGLPIGLAKHQEGAVAWVGVTCAACHTGMWKVGTDTVQIEGGPSMLDPDSFAAAVLASLKKTAEDPETFARFSQVTQATRDDVANLRDRAEQRVRINAHPVPAGFGRVDAFGTVFNQ
ncbi:MAG: hypothetical protein JO211_10690, partial [Acidobacteriaceae bacterium]|nr:hypothetical protein [Acidobacteriaceae bacterium]